VASSAAKVAPELEIHAKTTFSARLKSAESYFFHSE
jgi:hypothetical protein